MAKVKVAAATQAGYVQKIQEYLRKGDYYFVERMYLLMELHSRPNLWKPEHKQWDTFLKKFKLCTPAAYRKFVGKDGVRPLTKTQTYRFGVHGSDVIMHVSNKAVQDELISRCGKAVVALKHPLTYQHVVTLRDAIRKEMGLRNPPKKTWVRAYRRALDAANDQLEKHGVTRVPYPLKPE